MPGLCNVRSVLGDLALELGDLAIQLVATGLCSARKMLSAVGSISLHATRRWDFGPQ